MPRPQATLDEAMELLLFADGTVWEEAPPPQGPRPAALELIHALAAVQVGVRGALPRPVAAMQELGAGCDATFHGCWHTYVLLAALSLK